MTSISEKLLEHTAISLNKTVANPCHEEAGKLGGANRRDEDIPYFQENIQKNIGF